MKVTAQVIEKIMRGMTAKGMNQTQFAESLGMNRSYVSRLLRGDYQTIPDDQANKMSDILEVSLMPLVFHEGKVSQTAFQLSQHADEDPGFAAILEGLLALKGGDAKKAFLPSLDREELGIIGAKAIALSFEWDDGEESRAIKVGADLMTFIRELYRNRPPSPPSRPGEVDESI